MESNGSCPIAEVKPRKKSRYAVSRSAVAPFRVPPIHGLLTTSPGSSVEKANDLSFTILCSVTMTPEKYRYERAAAVRKNINLKERTDRGIGTWKSEKPVLSNKSLALTFKK